jgi:hypothetical protein
MQPHLINFLSYKNEKLKKQLHSISMDLISSDDPLMKEYNKTHSFISKLNRLIEWLTLAHEVICIFYGSDGPNRHFYVLDKSKKYVLWDLELEHEVDEKHVFSFISMVVLCHRKLVGDMRIPLSERYCGEYKPNPQKVKFCVKDLENIFLNFEKKNLKKIKENF